MTQGDEHDLLQQAVAGDHEALASLLEHHAAALRRRIEPRIPARFRGSFGVDDVMQQTYVDAYRDITAFDDRGDGAFAAWLNRLAERNLLDAVRMLEAQKRGGDRQRIEQRTREESCRELADLLLARGGTPSRIAAGREAIAHLERAIRSLPGVYHTVVEMFDIRGRPVEDVAAELDRSPGAVYMLRARAHRLLAELLGESSQFFSETA